MKQFWTQIIQDPDSERTSGCISKIQLAGRGKLATEEYMLVEQNMKHITLQLRLDDI